MRYASGLHQGPKTFSAILLANHVPGMIQSQSQSQDDQHDEPAILTKISSIVMHTRTGPEIVKEEEEASCGFPFEGKVVEENFAGCGEDWESVLADSEASFGELSSSPKEPLIFPTIFSEAPATVEIVLASPPFIRPNNDFDEPLC